MTINYKKDIDNFIEVVSKDEEIDLSLFYNNLKTLKVKYDDSNDKLFDMGYDNVKNEIFFADKETYDSSIYHELFHCASTKVEDDIVYSGLYIWNKDNKMMQGLGLNEGYTEILNHRYFGKKRVYPIQTHYIEMLEQIIDPEVLKLAYFSCNLRLVIYELSRYIEQEEVLKFIYYLDLYTIAFNTNQETSYTEEQVQEAITNCSVLLASAFVNKMVQEKPEDIVDRVFTFFGEFDKIVRLNENRNINLSIPIEKGFSILEKSGFKRK